MPNKSHLLHLEYEAFCVADVEEEVADDGGGLAVHHLQARAEPVVTWAVHHLMGKLHHFFQMRQIPKCIICKSLQPCDICSWRGRAWSPPARSGSGMQGRGGGNTCKIDGLMFRKKEVFSFSKVLDKFDCLLLQSNFSCLETCLCLRIPQIVGLCPFSSQFHTTWCPASSPGPSQGSSPCSCPGQGTQRQRLRSGQKAIPPKGRSCPAERWCSSHFPPSPPRLLSCGARADLEKSTIYLKAIYLLRFFVSKSCYKKHYKFEISISHVKDKCLFK